jgi:hypothetical protein
MQENRSALARAVTALLDRYRVTLDLAEDEHANVPPNVYVGYRAVERWSGELNQD